MNTKIHYCQNCVTLNYKHWIVNAQPATFQCKKNSKQYTDVNTLCKQHVR